jgi:hypothetical protein
MISMTASALTWSQPVHPPENRPLSAYFADHHDIAAHHMLAVQTALNHRIFSGFPDSTFRPHAQASRMEAVSVAVSLAWVLGHID